MKKFLTLLFCTCFAAFSFAYTATIYVNGFGLSYSISNGEVTITDYSTSASGALAIPKILDGYPVTSIGYQAFYKCSSLTSVTIPEGVKTIGYEAFYECRGLTSVTIPSSVTAIGIRAFDGCRGLTSVTIPSSATSIGQSAFSGVSPTTLTAAYLPDGIGGMSSNKLTTLIIPEGVTSIGDSAFYGCSSLTSVTIPSSVTSIGEGAFAGCSSLTSVMFEGVPPWVGSYAFVGVASGCKGYYPSTKAAEWEAVISNGTWNWLTMEMYEDPILSLLTYTISNGEVTITDCDTSASGEFEIPSTLGGSPVTSIGYKAFGYCTKLTSVTIPSSVTSIGDYAFYNCSGLTSVTIPDSVTEIGAFVFWNCNSLASVTIPSSVTSIGIWAFKDCPSLTSVTIPEGVTSIGASAFSGCSSLTSVTIPEGVTTVGNGAFSGCSGLTSITIPEGVTSIGDSVFSGCSSLPKDENGVQYESEAKVVLIDVPTSMTGEFVISNTVRFIHSDAFEGCSGLTSVTIPEGVKTIGWGVVGNSAFCHCSGLTSFVVDSANQHYTVMNNLLCSKDGKTLIVCPARLTSVTIPEGVTSIGDYAFYHCSGLTSVTIPEGVTTIGNEAFSGCSSLTSVTIPEGVTSIGFGAFYKCSSLTSVTIPESVTSIGYRGFEGCSGLTSVTFEGVPPKVGSDVFYNIPSSATGTYLPQYASKWAAVIDANGKWNGLTMVRKWMATLPEGLPNATGDWLTDVLEASGVTSGSAVLAEGTTAASLEAARLLGITPSVLVEGSVATVAAESDFSVSEVAVTDETLSLTVTITAENGVFPAAVSLGGVVTLMVCDDLNGEWTEVAPSPSQITLTRVSETEATLSVTQALNTYKFFKVVVK